MRTRIPYPLLMVLASSMARENPARTIRFVFTCLTWMHLTRGPEPTADGARCLQSRRTLLWYHWYYMTTPELPAGWQTRPGKCRCRCRRSLPLRTWPGGIRSTEGTARARCTIHVMARRPQPGCPTQCISAQTWSGNSRGRASRAAP